MTNQEVIERLRYLHAKKNGGGSGDNTNPYGCEYFDKDWNFLRPTDWPNLDIFDMKNNYGIILSFDCRPRIADNKRPDGIYIYQGGSGTVTIQRGVIVNNEFVVNQTSTITSSNKAFAELLPIDEGDYVVYKITTANPTTSAALVYVYFYSDSSTVTDDVRTADDWRAFNSTCIECLVNVPGICILPVLRSPYLRHYEAYDVKSLVVGSSTYKLRGFCFQYCSGLEYLNLKGWENTNISSGLNNAFSYCSSLRVLEKDNNWNLANGTTFANAFNHCNSIEELDVSVFNTAKVTSFSQLFYQCSNLKIIDVSTWNTALVTTMSSTFIYCSRVERLDLSSWNTVKVTSMNYMFDSCKNLKTLILGNNFVATALTNASYMFRRCIAMETNPLSGKTWNTAKVTTFTTMFYECINLVEMDMGNWDFTKITNINGTSDMFSYCRKLTKVVFPVTCTILNANIFNYCYNLEVIIVNATTPPTWAVTTAYLNRLHPDYKIYVPDASVDAYKAASGWSNASSHIYSIMEMNIITN